MPDATGLELIAQDLRAAHGDDAVVGTHFFRDKAAVDVAPERGVGSATAHPFRRAFDENGSIGKE